MKIETLTPRMKRRLAIYGVIIDIYNHICTEFPEARNKFALTWRTFNGEQYAEFRKRYPDAPTSQPAIVKVIRGQYKAQQIVAQMAAEEGGKR